MNFTGSHILTVDQFELADVQRIFETATMMEPFALRRRRSRVLEGALLGNLFFEASTRSRFSFAAAFERLGGAVRDMIGFEHTSFQKGESIHDTSRVMSGYVDVMVVRHPELGKVDEFARATNVPVINSGDGTGEHPTQALLDLYTVQKETKTPIEKIKGLRVAVVGDLRHGRTVHSLVKIMALLDRLHFTFVAPDALQMPDELVAYAHSRGHDVVTTESLDDGLDGADLVYCTRLQEERFATAGEAARYRGMYAVNRQVFEKRCKPNAFLMHPLPRDSRIGAMEISLDMDEHPGLAIFRQADNGIAVRMALFVLLLGVADQVQATATDVPWFVPNKFGTKDC
jgi:aspartate carbamoyltransferase catalytic subunit